MKKRKKRCDVGHPIEEIEVLRVSRFNEGDRETQFRCRQCGKTWKPPRNASLLRRYHAPPVYFEAVQMAEVFDAVDQAMAEWRREWEAQGRLYMFRAGQPRGKEYWGSMIIDDKVV